MNSTARHAALLGIVLIAAVDTEYSSVCFGLLFQVPGLRSATKALTEQAGIEQTKHDA